MHTSRKKRAAKTGCGLLLHFNNSRYVIFYKNGIDIQILHIFIKMELAWFPV
jgi:hypothetical protein